MPSFGCQGNTFSRSLEIAKHGPLCLMLSEMAGCPVKGLWHLRGTEASAEVKRLAPRALGGNAAHHRPLRSSLGRPFLKRPRPGHCGKKSSRRQLLAIRQKKCLPSILHRHCQTQHRRGEVLLGRKGSSLAAGPCLASQCISSLLRWVQEGIMGCAVSPPYSCVEVVIPSTLERDSI